MLKGIEVGILEDGSLDLPDAALQGLDLVVGAVHSAFDLPQRKPTQRTLRALDSRYFTVVAYPAGRLLGQPEAMDADWLHIVRAAKQRGCFLELNAHPDRLDLDDVHCWWRGRRAYSWPSTPMRMALLRTRGSRFFMELG